MQRGCAGSVLPFCSVAFPGGCVPVLGDGLEVSQKESVQRCAPFLFELFSVHILGFYLYGSV